MRQKKRPPSTRRHPLRTALLCVIAAATIVPAFAQKRSPLGRTPRWQSLDVFQETMTKAEFEEALYTVYASPASVKPTMRFGEDFVEIQKMLGTDDFWKLTFADASSPPESGRYWRGATELSGAIAGLPLEGLKIAIDPGHLGGDWAKMEERWFKIGEDEAITEGDLTLFTAGIVKTELEKYGAFVTLVRESSDPITEDRPAKLDSAARLFLAQRGVSNPPLTYEADDHSEQRLFSIQWQREKLFYRTSEILARADKINNEIRPDLCLCLHYNAEGWGDPAEPSYVESNHFHLLVNGTYSLGELSHDDVRFEMVSRLLQGIHHEEAALAAAVAPAMAQETGLPPYLYPGDNARRTGDDPNIWARNLLANRVYLCPVLYFEPYVMNNESVHERLVYGDYLGKSKIGGRMRRSIYREYAAGIVEGILTYYRAERALTP